MDEISQVVAPLPSALQWFQLYVETDRTTTANLVRRCEKLGFKALVVTVDRPRLGRRLDDVRTGFRLPRHLQQGNFESNDDTRTGEGAYLTGQIDASLKWSDLTWLRSLTSLPIVIKGIFRAEDARLACQHGVAGIIVSNHGGRQLDGCPATVSTYPCKRVERE
jgi:(S)-2-hydroxy-acid oxidase